MSGSSVADIRNSLGAALFGLLVSTTCVLPLALSSSAFILNYETCRLLGVSIVQT